MPARHHNLRSTITLALVCLLGPAACDDAALEPADPRESSIHKTSYACGERVVTLTHDDGTIDVTSDLDPDLAGLARPNDIVEVDLGLTIDCLAGHGSHMSLVAATQQIVSEGQGYGNLWDVDTAKLAAGDTVLSVQLPNCAYTLALTLGEPLTEQELAGDALDERSIIWSGADKQRCADAP